MTTLSTFLDSQTTRFGRQPALQYRPRYRTIRWSHEELAGHTARLTLALTTAGIRPGDRVLLQSENSPNWVAAFFAVTQCGAVLVPLNPRSTPEQIQRIVESARPRLLLRSARCQAMDTSVPEWIIDSTAFKSVALASDDAMARRQPADLAEIIYTSGTTGDPKGVMLTHGNLLSDMEALSQAVPLAPHHKILNLVPLFHAYGQMTGMLCPLLGGCEVSHVTLPTSRTIQEALAHVPATHLILVPEILKTLMDRLEHRLGHIPGFMTRFLRERIRARISRTLHTIVSAGAPLDPELEEKCRSLGFEVLQGYGLTETSPAVTVNSPEAHRTGSVGKPLAGVDLKLAADGEILVRGPMVMAGYYEQPQRTEAAFAEGWFKTGDIGRIDHEGFLYLHGRKQYMIIGAGGENVFPEDLESELNRIDGVGDSAVVGLVEAGRTVIHAVLICHPDQAQSVVDQANRKLAPHQQIASWSLWPEADFPRSVTRKVRKEVVIRRLMQDKSLQAMELSERQATPLRRLLAEVSGMPVAAIDDDTRILAGLKIDSMLRIELVSRIEEWLGVSIEEARITPDLTVAALEALLQSKAPVLTHLIPYPRWSLLPWAGRVRPLAIRLFLQSWIPLCCRLQVEGLEHLAELTGPAIFMANHRSYLDGAIATLALPTRFRSRLSIAAATDVLYRQYPWAVPLVELTFNAFPLPTGIQENIQAGFNYIGRLLDDGWGVLLFPEGQMNRRDGSLMRLKGGTGVIAVEMQAPVIPMTIEGTEKIMPPGRLLPRSKGLVRIRFGRPLYFDAGMSFNGATAEIEDAMRGLLEEQALVIHHGGN